MDILGFIESHLLVIGIALVFVLAILFFLPDEPMGDLLEKAREWIMDHAVAGVLFSLYAIASLLIFVYVINPFVSIADIDSNKVILLLLTYLTLRSIKLGYK